MEVSEFGAAGEDSAFGGFGFGGGPFSIARGTAGGIKLNQGQYGQSTNRWEPNFPI